MRISDWSSDVCSSDLSLPLGEQDHRRLLQGQARGAVLAARRLHADLLDLPAPGFRQALSGVPDQRHRRDLLSLGERRLRDECLGQAAGPEQHQAHSRSEEHTSELQSLMRISYAVFCLKKKKYHTSKLQP